MDGHNNTQCRVVTFEVMTVDLTPMSSDEFRVTYRTNGAKRAFQLLNKFNDYIAIRIFHLQPRDVTSHQHYLLLLWLCVHVCLHPHEGLHVSYWDAQV